MNWEEVEGKWNQLKSLIKVKWAKLTDNDLELIAGKRDLLVGKIQQRYGIAKEEAEKQVNEWKMAYDTHAEYRTARKVG